MSYYSRSSSRATDCKVYVGDLGNGAAKGELERAFSYYGPLRTVWVARNPPGFAFVEFEDPRDAEDAVKGMDGKWVLLFVEAITFSTQIKLKRCLICSSLNVYFVFSGFSVGLVFVWKCLRVSLEKDVGDPVVGSLILMTVVTSVETGATTPTTATGSARGAVAAGTFCRY